MMMSDPGYLKSMKDYLLIPDDEDLTQAEKNIYKDLNSLEKEITEDYGPEMFEQAEDFKEEGFDPASAYLGFIIGVQVYAQRLFEEIVEIGHSKPEGRVLH